MIYAILSYNVITYIFFLRTKFCVILRIVVQFFDPRNREVLCLIPLSRNICFTHFIMTSLLYSRSLFRLKIINEKGGIVELLTEKMRFFFHLKLACTCRRPHYRLICHNIMVHTSMFNITF